MSNYVATYRRLDDNAARAETQAEEYRQRADHDRWEQCRIAHEAVESGEYSQMSFGKAVSKARTTIGVQTRMWARWGAHPAVQRPPYHEAFAEINMTPAGPEKTRANAFSQARNMPAADKAKLAAELLDDDQVEVAPSVIARQASRPDVARAIARHDDAREAVEEAGIEHRARHMPDDIPEPAAAGRRAGASMARRVEMDLATGALRNAAGALAEAIVCKEEFGINYPDDEAEALGRVERYLAAYKGGGHVSDDDKSWLESIGVSL